MSDVYALTRNGQLTEAKLDKFLQSMSVDVEQSKNPFTLLVEAARHGHHSIVRLLLDKGAQVNRKGSHGRTPLHYAIRAKKNREETVKAILEYKADVDAPDDDGNTPLIVVISDNLGLPVLRLLVANGASPTKENQNGVTPKDLANRSTNHEVKRALFPEEAHAPGRLEFIDTIVNLVLFILAYVDSGAVKGVVKGIVSNLYHIVGNTELDPEPAKDIKNPTTIDDFKTNINNFVTRENPELSAFFAPGNDFFQKVAEKAVELKDDPKNQLKAPDHINDLTRLALYQPILYCDDSGSMATVDDGHTSRQQLLRALVTRMSSVATRLVPDSEGVHLRFINRMEPRRGAYDSLSKDQIDKAINFEPSGGTQIGTELRKRILKPFVFDVFKRGEKLKRPILVLVVTDGCPTEDDKGAFKKAIVECGQALAEKGYEPEAVRFLVSRIGKDKAAVEFLHSLGGDIAIERVVHRTSGPLDEKFSALQKNERHVEEWLLDVLMSPIIGRSRH